MRSFSIILILASICSAREVLTLRNGFTLEVRSHTFRDGTLLVETDAGSLEFPASEVSGIQAFSEPAANVEAPKQAIPNLDPEAILRQAAVTQGLAPELVRSVAKVESGLHPDALSPKGAQGLMQLMPGTAGTLKVAADNPAENAKGGATYLRQLLLQYHGDAALALAAYNAGPGVVARYGGIPPYPETRKYVIRVLEELAKEQRRKK